MIPVLFVLVAFPSWYVHLLGSHRHRREINKVQFQMAIRGMVDLGSCRKGWRWRNSDYGYSLNWLRLRLRIGNTLNILWFCQALNHLRLDYLKYSRLI
jgi:hypothetical protein